MKNILLVEPNELFRAGIKQLLSTMIDVAIVAETSNAEGALQIARQQTLDLILMEWNTPGITGLESTSRLMKAQPQLKIIILTAHAEMPFPSLLMSAGASGFISKVSPTSEIMRGLRAVLANREYISNDVAQCMAQNVARPNNRSPFEDLSSRELQVMLMVLDGLPVGEISRQLCLSPKTVSTYRHRLFGKLKVKSEAELTKMAMRYGVVEQAYMVLNQVESQGFTAEFCEEMFLQKAANF